jgi:group I intron endonuclease
MTQVIYKIINTFNGKFYVGSTTNQKVRFRQHRKLLRGNRHHCKHLQAAWNKYGEDKFIFVVIEEVPATRALWEVEDVWLKEHVGKEHCYNAGRSADAPMRGRTGASHPGFGKTMHQPQKEAISSTLKAYYAEDYANHPRVGTTHSEDTRAKISAAKKENPQRHWLGKTRDEETRKKIGDAQRGVKKAARTYTTAGLEKARANMLRNARAQVPAPFTEVLNKFPQEVKDKYDFSKAAYTGALKRITGLVCPEHGEFSQYAAQLRKGCGCPLCGTAARKKKTLQNPINM